MIMIDRAEIEAQGKKLIPFPDVTKNYQPMFWLEDGKFLEVTTPSGSKCARTCTYHSPHHFSFGSNLYHIDQFAKQNHSHGNTCQPMEQVTDLSVFRKFFADRQLCDDNKQIIPYRAILAWDAEPCMGYPQRVLSICPEAQPDRQVAYRTVEGTDFYSIPEAWTTLLPIALPETKHELNLISAIFEENNRLVEHISKKEWDALPADYKGVYNDFDGRHPDWEGRKTAFLPGHGTTLFIEGVSFVIDKGKTLDQQIAGAAQRRGEGKEKPKQEPAPER